MGNSHTSISYQVLIVWLSNLFFLMACIKSCWILHWSLIFIPFPKVTVSCGNVTIVYIICGFSPTSLCCIWQCSQLISGGVGGHMWYLKSNHGQVHARQVPVLSIWPHVSMLTWSPSFPSSPPPPSLLFSPPLLLSFFFSHSHSPPEACNVTPAFALKSLLAGLGELNLENLHHVSCIIALTHVS